MKKIFSNIGKHLYIYLINLILVVFISSLLVNIATKASAKEKCSIYIGAYTCNTQQLEQYINEEEYQYVKEIEINFHSTAEDYYKYYLNLQVRSSDIIIVQESDITRMNFDYFVEFSDVFCAEHNITDNPFYTYENKNYGLCVNSKTSGPLFLNDYINYQKDNLNNDEKENFYLFINAKSLHVGNYGSDTIDDDALTILRRLINA